MPAAIAARPATEAPSLKLEREANELLVKGDQNAAAAKFSEADRLSVGESLAAVNAKAAVPARPVSDPAVQQIAASRARIGTRPGRAHGQPRGDSRRHAAGTGPRRAAGTNGRSRTRHHRPLSAIAASNCWARPSSCTRTAITRLPSRWRSRQRLASLALKLRPTS